MSQCMTLARRVQVWKVLHLYRLLEAKKLQHLNDSRAFEGGISNSARDILMPSLESDSQLLRISLRAVNELKDQSRHQHQISIANRFSYLSRHRAPLLLTRVACVHLFRQLNGNLFLLRPNVRICMDSSPEQDIDFFKRYTFRLRYEEPNVDEQDHVDGTEHVHRIEALVGQEEWEYLL